MLFHSGRKCVVPLNQGGKTSKWRGEQATLRRDLERHEQADHYYVNEGVALLELASQAESLFRSQPAAEKRKLLDFVRSNSCWGNRTLTLEFRQPLDLIANGAKLSASEEAVGSVPDSLCPVKGGWVDAYRTLILSPPLPVRRLLEGLKDLKWPAA